MDFQKHLSKNLILHYTDVITCNPGGSARIIRFWFTFFGEGCFADFSKKNIEKDWSHVTFSEAPSEIFDSFEEQITDTHWDFIKDAFLKTEAEHNREYAY